MDYLAQVAGDDEVLSLGLMICCKLQPYLFDDEFSHKGVLGAEVDQHLEAKVLCLSPLSVRLKNAK